MIKGSGVNIYTCLVCVAVIEITVLLLQYAISLVVVICGQIALATMALVNRSWVSTNIIIIDILSSDAFQEGRNKTWLIILYSLPIWTLHVDYRVDPFDFNPIV